MIRIVEVFSKQKFWACIEMNLYESISEKKKKQEENINHESDNREKLLVVRTQNIEWLPFSLSQYNTKIQL